MSAIYLPNSRASLDRIKEAVADAYDLTVEELTQKTRVQPVAFARQVAMYLASELTLASRQEIARAMGLSDHGTAIHAIKRIRRAIRPPRVSTISIEEDQRQRLVKLITIITNKVTENEQHSA